MYQTEWDHGVFKRAQWLYDLHIPTNSYAVIHTPLLFLTKLTIQQELYARAAVIFAGLLDSGEQLRPEIIDSVVVRFPLASLEPWRYSIFQKFSEGLYYQERMIKLILLIKRWLPVQTIAAEKEFLQTKSVSETKITRLFFLVSLAIAANMANPFFEIIYLRSQENSKNKAAFKKQVEETLWPPVFSHMTYYKAVLEDLQQKTDKDELSVEDIYHFAFHTAFLDNSIGDGSPLEVPQVLAETLNYSLPGNHDLCTYMKPSMVELPDIIFDPHYLTDSVPAAQNQVHLILFILRFLQVNEEFRHYWGLRVIRLFRLLAPHVSASENWNLRDYGRYCKQP
jgi:hypothetical protein